jgi:hypothetical protein
MDQARRELFVEGPRDRLFLSWLASSGKDPNVSIIEIDFVELPELPGGNKGRLIYFAEQLGRGACDVRIQMFADADWDRLLERPVPARVWITDHRDMEGYLLRVECLEKVLRLGLGNAAVSAEVVLTSIKEHARRLCLLRLTSEIHGLAFSASSAESVG